MPHGEVFTPLCPRKASEYFAAVVAKKGLPLGTKSCTTLQFIGNRYKLTAKILLSESMALKIDVQSKWLVYCSNPASWHTIISVAP